MIVAIAPCIDEEIERLLRCVGQISVRLREFFANKSYGDDIETMFVAVCKVRAVCGSCNSKSESGE
jgi:hypothetical protein